MSLWARPRAARADEVAVVRVLRFPIAFVLAFSLTGSLFWLLWTLINVNVEAASLKPAQKIQFTRLRRDTDVRTSRQQKVQREKPVQLATAPQMSKSAFGGGEALEVMAPSVDALAGLQKLSVNVGGSDRDVIPLVRIEPDYPARAASRGIEGYVVVQFTITPAGTIKDPKVVEAQPSGIFDQAAIKAVSKWKYNPKVEDGVAVERRGVQVKLAFKLEK
jgi:periplasmic protein TonB